MTRFGLLHPVVLAAMQGGAGPVVPATPDGWWDARQLVGYSDGDPVATWPDAAGGIGDMLAVSTSPAYRASEGPGPSVDITGTTGMRRLLGSLQTKSVLTVGVIFRAPVMATTNLYLFDGGSSTAYRAALLRQAGDKVTAFRGVTLSSPTPASPPLGWSYVVTLMSGSSSKIDTPSGEVSGSCGTQTQMTEFHLGTAYNNTSPHDDRIAEVVLYESDQYTDLRAYLRVRLGLAP